MTASQCQELGGTQTFWSLPPEGIVLETPSLQKCERINVFKPPSLWYVAMVALGN